MGLRMGNRTFPLWDLGATLYWRSASPSVVQTPGGIGNLTTSYLDDVGFTPTNPYYVYDVYKGHFRQVDPTVAVEFPPSGFVAPPRDNYFDNSQTDNDRGFNTIDVGLIIINDPIPDDYIVDVSTTSLPITTLFRVQNTSGGALRFSEAEVISTSLRRNFSILAKRTGGGVIDSSVCQLYIAATHAGANEGTATSYKRIRSDGWYELMMSISPDLASAKYLGVIIQDGYTIDFEMPGQESSGTTSGSSISAGTNPPPNLGVTPSGGTVAVNFKRDTVDEAWPQSGWIGCTSVYPYSQAELNKIGTPPPSDELPAGILVNWGVSSSDRIRLVISRTYQSVAAELDTSPGVTMTVSSLTRVGSTASAVTTGNHGFTNGQRIVIAGTTQDDYNGNFVITVTGLDTFDYTVSGTPTTPATGTITADSSDFFLNETPDIGIGDVKGVVISWGKRGDTFIAYLFINGQQIEISTSSFAGIPLGTPAAIEVGFQDSGGAPITIATCWIQQIAVGRTLLTRQECRHLSKWFEQQAFHELEVV